VRRRAPAVTAVVVKEIVEGLRAFLGHPYDRGASGPLTGSDHGVRAGVIDGTVWRMEW